MRKSILIDVSKCMACRACQVSCKQWNQLPAEETTFTGNYENPTSISPITWMRVTFKEVEDGDKVKWHFGNVRCMHCTDAACEQVCPAGAINHTEEGIVHIDEQKCIGCNWCLSNCPFQVMGFNRRDNVAEKCTMCIDRVNSGLKPACSAACPTDAIRFGDRSELISIAEERVQKLQANGNPEARLYGVEELEGTGTMFVLQSSPQEYGLPEDPEVPLSARAWGHLFSPLRVVAVVAVAFGLWANWGRTKKIKGKKK